MDKGLITVTCPFVLSLLFLVLAKHRLTAVEISVPKQNIAEKAGIIFFHLLIVLSCLWLELYFLVNV